MRKPILVALCALVACFPLRAEAVTRVVEPASDPFHVALEAGGQPIAFTLRVTGFAAGTQIYAEQCDGRDPQSREWTAARDCDVHAFPQPAIVAPDGSASFDVRPFAGPSPQGQFNCLAPRASSPHNGLTDFRNCRVRVSSNIGYATPDQAFVRIVLGPSAGSDFPWWLVIVGALVVLAVVAGATLVRRSRAAGR